MLSNSNFKVVEVEHYSNMIREGQTCRDTKSSKASLRVNRSSFACSCPHVRRARIDCGSAWSLYVADDGIKLKEPSLSTNWKRLLVVTAVLGAEAVESIG